MIFVQTTAVNQQSFLSQFRHLALPTLFALFGLIMGTWAGRIPALRDGVHASHSALSMVLLCGGLGAVLSFPVSSRMMAGLGGRKTMLCSGMALLVALVSIGLAPNVLMLKVAVLMLGIAASCFDVAMNSVAAVHEETSGQSHLSTLHAWCCGGALAGAAFGSLMAGMHIHPVMHFSMIASAVACMLWLGCDMLETDDVGKKIEKKSFALPRGPLVLLGALGFFGSVAEGSIADWSGIFLKDHFGVTDGFAPLALSAFSVMMLITRIIGDRLKGSHSPRRLLGIGGLLGALGLFFAVFAPNAYCALGGFALAGLGMALVFPFVFSAAGREGPIALAGVATMAYSGSLMGPPMLGAVAHNFGMQAAMGFIGILSAASAVIASRSAMLG
ncbi:MAG: MFS transporter [Burkholderiaceae bacterium]